VAEKPLHVFIDTNVLLSFYAFTNDDLEQLKKLSGLIKSGDLALYLSTHSRDEFQRNREAKLSETLRQFEKVGQVAVPRFMEGYAELKDFQIAGDTLKKARNTLIQHAREEAAKNGLAADKLVNQLFLTGLIKVEASHISKAKERLLLGNPPGKSGSIGDRIHWEMLLSKVPKGATLHIVSKDGDYQSALSADRPHQFLVDEWAERMKGDLRLHDEIKPFLTKHFPEIKLSTDIEKQAAIEQLVNSGSFSSTHNAVAKLSSLKETLTFNEIVKLLQATIANNQISWIASDTDVYNFYRSIVDPVFDKLNTELQAHADKTFHIKTVAKAADEEVPF
jgi:hypothetical protein